MEDFDNVSDNTIAAFIPVTTVKRYARKANELIEKGKSVDYGRLYTPTAATNNRSFTSKLQQQFLGDVAKARDENNNGMSRKEMIHLILHLVGSNKTKKADNHFDYLVRTGKLPQLKQGGKVLSVQKTTTKRSQVTISQQLRWHTVINDLLADLTRLNANPPGVYAKIQKYFVGNLDESSMTGSAGKVKVLASVDKRKQEKIMDDCRDSITVVRTGSAAGTPGPLFVLAAGKVKLRSVALEKQLREQAPPFSKIITAPSAYMTDEAWLEIVPLLCEGIRAMPKVSEHPEWWFGLSLDGYGSHLKEDALEIFADYHIMIVKEEGDSSQTNQAYDQRVAREDKRIISEKIDHLCAHNKSLVINQKYLIGISIHAISLVEAKTWEKSFI